MSHLRLTSSADAIDDTESAGGTPPSAGAVRFASFTPMNDQPGLADRKAMFVIGAAGLLLSTTLFLVTPLDQFLRPGPWPALPLVLSIGVGCASVLGLRAAYGAYVLQAPDAPGNLLFFRNIAAGPAADYADRLAAATPRDVLLDVLAYNHATARLGVAKYRLVGRAMACLRVAIPLWILLLLVLTARGA